MNFIKKNCFKIILLAFMLVLPVISFAADVDGTATKPSIPPVTLKNPIPSITSINGLIQKILTGAIKLGIPVIALAIIYCGFLFVAARGNSEKLSKAKDALLYTLIGAAILLGSWGIATMISSTVKGLG